MTQLDWGETCSVEEFQVKLLERLDGDIISPDTFGPSVITACEASYEDICRGAPIEFVAPFWRMIKPDSEIANLLSFGGDWIKEKRRKESGIETTWGRAHRLMGFTWPTDEEVGNDPIEHILDFRVNEVLFDCFLGEDEFEFCDITNCAFIYEGKPWWAVFRDLSCAADFPMALEMPLYEEFEGTEFSGFEFAETIAERIGKPFRRLGPFEDPIQYEVWEFSEVAA
ncbi:MAG: hypothetical protein ACKVQS_02860 [Fimbriimonadaceae bacterium]